MNLTQFLLILKSRWRMIAIGGLVGLVLGLLWSITSTRNYKAEAQVLVTVRAPDTVGTDISGVTPQLAPDYLATQVDVIRSDRVATSAVDKVGLTQDPELMQRYQAAGAPGSPSAFVARIIRAGLTVVPSPESRVITIAYNSPDPSAAKAIANAFAEAYRDVSLDLQAEPARQAATMYEKSAATIRTRLADAQKMLAERRAALHVTAVPEQADVDDTRLAALSQQLASAQAAQAAQSAHTGGGALPDAMLSPVVQNLQSEIARLEAQRRQLATVAGPNNVDYRQVVEQLTTLRSELDRQKKLVAQSAATAAAQSAASVGSLSSALEAQRGRTIASQRARGEIAALEQDVLNLKQTYDEVNKRQTQADMIGSANQTNVSILSPATQPLVPSGMSPIVKLIAAMILGLSIGLLAALFREFLDQRVRAPEDAAIWLGIPNLGGVRALHAPPQGFIGGTVRRYLPGASDKDDQ